MRMLLFLVLLWVDVNAQNRCCTRYCGNNNLNIPWEAIKVGTDPLKSAYIWRFSAYQTGNLTAVHMTNVTVVPGDYMWIQNNAGLEGSSPSTAYKVRVESAAGGIPYDFWLVPSPLPTALSTGARVNPSSSSGLLPVTGQNFQFPVDRTGSWVVKVQGFNNPTSATYWLDYNASTPTDNYAQITMNSFIPNPAPPVQITVGQQDWSQGLTGANVTGSPPTQQIKIQLDGQVIWNNPTTYAVRIDKNLSNPLMTASSWNRADLSATQVSTTEQLQNVVNRKYFYLAYTWVLFESRVGNASIVGPQYAIVVENPFIANRSGLLGVFVDAADNYDCVAPPPTGGSSSDSGNSSSSTSYEPVPLVISIVGIALPMFIMYCVVPCVYICWKNRPKM